MDVWQVIELVRKNQLKGLKKALHQGVDPNQACEYTGMHALLAACEENNLEAARLLLAAGANPNAQHFDGYNCYDSSQSSEVKHLLLQQGYRLVDSTWSQSGDSLALRLMSAVEPITRDQQLELTNAGTQFKLEYKLYASPQNQGQLKLRLEPEIYRIDLPQAQALHHTESLQLDKEMTLRLNIQALSFTGDFRVRLYNLNVLDSQLANIITYPWPD